MSKGSAIVAIVLAAVFGFVAGQLSAKKGVGEIADASEEGAEVGAVAGVQEDDAVERFKVPVSAANPQKGPADAAVTVVIFSDFTVYAGPAAWDT